MTMTWLPDFKIFAAVCLTADGGAVFIRYSIILC